MADEAGGILSEDALRRGIVGAFAVGCLRGQRRRMDLAESVPPNERLAYADMLGVFESKAVINGKEFDAMVNAVDASGARPEWFAESLYGQTFTMVREGDQRIIESVSSNLRRGIRDQWTASDFLTNIGDVYGAAGIDQQEFWYGELVFNNAMNRADQEGIDTVAADMAQDGVLWGYRWEHSGAENYRPAHKALDGWAAPSTDPRWEQIGTPPIGHNCGCKRTPLTPDEAARNGYDTNPPTPLVSEGDYTGKDAIWTLDNAPDERFPPSRWGRASRPFLNPSYDLPRTPYAGGTPTPTKPRVPGGPMLPVPGPKPKPPPSKTAPPKPPTGPDKGLAPEAVIAERRARPLVEAEALAEPKAREALERIKKELPKAEARTAKKIARIREKRAALMVEESDWYFHKVRLAAARNEALKAGAHVKVPYPEFGSNVNNKMGRWVDIADAHEAAGAKVRKLAKQQDDLLTKIFQLEDQTKAEAVRRALRTTPKTARLELHVGKVTNLDTGAKGRIPPNAKPTMEWLEEVAHRDATKTPYTTTSFTTNIRIYPKKSAPNTRAQAAQDTIWLRRTEKKSVVAHELGHTIEDRNGNVRRRTNEWLDKRVAGKAKKPLADITGSNYDPHEFAYENAGFVSPYVGKEYGGGPGTSRATEVLSMGLDRLYGDALKFAEKDWDHFRLTVSLLKGWM